MAKAHAEATALIAAAPEKVYAVLADYRTHHPNILPRENFFNMVIEEGGVGAGTVFRVDGKVGGMARPLHMRVSEPQPGRVLAETDQLSGMHTTFTVAPEGSASRLIIATDWDTAPGLMGWLESKLAPGMLEKMYRVELANLEKYLAQLG